MNAPHSPSLLAQVVMAPSDPILGITEAYVADPNPKKVNLGVGVYYDDAGKVPLLECVRRAESERLKAAPPRNYLPIDGLAAYDRAVQELVFGKEFAAVTEKRIVTVQAIGGTGGLKIGADFLRMACEIHRFIGRVMPGMRDNLALATRFLDYDLDGADALFLGQGPEFSHGAGAEDPIHAKLVGEIAHVAPQACFIQRIIRRKRRGDRRPNAAKLRPRRFLGFRFSVVHGTSSY